MPVERCSMDHDDCELEAEVMTAHARGATADLARIYREAALAREAGGDVEAACFLFTHAYVFALEAGLPEQDDIARRLEHYGREPV